MRVLVLCFSEGSVEAEITLGELTDAEAGSDRDRSESVVDLFDLIGEDADLFLI